MKKIFILIFIILLTGCTNDDIYERIDNVEAKKNIANKSQYYINALYDEDETSLIVKQKIVYYSVDDLKEIYLNVYGNALSDGKPMVDINSLKIDGKIAEWKWSAENYANIYIPSTDIIDKNQEVTIDIEYTLELSEGGKRFAVKKLNSSQEEFDIVAMFFYPVVAMHDESGWHLEPHSFKGEVYYNSISDYYVNLELPSKYKLATGGVIKSQEDKDDFTIYEIELINGRDYSFSASVNYSEFSREINGIDVNIKSLQQISNTEVDKIFKVTEEAIKFGEDILGQYIYDTFTIELGHIYGMESSSIIYCSTDKINYKTIVHEIYHQWFYSIIGNNQGDESWLDEGLTTFLTGEFITHNQDLIDYDYYASYDTNGERYRSYHNVHDGKSVLRNVHDFEDDYGLLVYWYGTTILHYYVEDLLDGNEELMYQALRKYYEDYNLKIATIDDFLNLLEEETRVENTKEWIMAHLNEFQYVNYDPEVDIDEYVKTTNAFDKVDDVITKEYTVNKDQYYINAFLDTDTSLLTVKQKIVYNANTDLSELFLNVYPNAQSDDEPYVKINTLELNNKDTFWYWSDERYSNILIDLPEDINEGEEVEIDIEYVLEFSEGDNRFSKQKFDDYQRNWDYVSLFFYPVVAMYDSNGWHLDPHSFNGEVYYNTVADYYVNLEIPNDYVLATGGKVINKEVLNNTSKYEIELLDGRDYSFSASDRYIEHTKNINDIEVSILAIDDISDADINKIFEVTEKSIEFAEDIIGEYIYDTLTIELGRIYGMESSSIIYCSNDINYKTIVHEIYHQWFYSMIGNNQGDEPWLDEGLTTFLTGEFVINNQELFPRDYYEQYDMNQGKYSKYHDMFDGNSVLRNVHEYNHVDHEYAALVYYYGTTVLHYYVENLLDSNEQLMYDALKTYYNEYNKEIANIDSFLDLLEEETGVDNTKEWIIEHLSEFQVIQ